MDLIKLEVTEKKMQGLRIIKNKQSTTDAAPGLFRSSSSTAQKVTTMVGFDDVLYEMLDNIAGEGRLRQIIHIVGMGGLGKTTLARNIYENPLVKEHFDICVWSTISQVHNARMILTGILGQVNRNDEGDLSEYELGRKLYMYLIGKRYLIVIDNMWSTEAWNVVRDFFPDNDKGSRVVVTTRLSNLASKFDYSDGLDMKFMDKATSWKLFSKTVFGDEFCPLELEGVGKKIVEGCRGLPLSIVVVGGLLLKSEPTRENWEVIEENLSSFVNLEDEGSCLQILYMCYNNMPVHLKTCFLYIGVYPEEDEIPVPLLVQLMVAEGFIKPIDGKSLEEAAEEYLEELVDRNLVLAGQCNEYGKLETCKIHNLLSDLALREGEKEEFSYWLEQNKSRGDREISQGMTSGQRRITNLFGDEDTSSVVVLGSVEVAAGSALVRSLIGRFPAGTLALPSSRLLRVCFVEEESSDEYCEETSIPLLNLRFLLVHAEEIPSYLWNLQALLLIEVDKDYVLEIWKMPLLRLVITHNALCLPDPPPVGDDEVVLENLHSLYLVRNVKLSEEVLKRIPNIRILKLCYQPEEEEEEEEQEQEEEQEEEEDYSLNNLHRLNKLQELDLIIWYGWNLPSIQELSLPYSLKQLTLRGTKLPWEEMTSKIGCLPLLQVLQLGFGAFIGSEWETVEGQFLSLKFLEIESCHDLESWMTDKSHFPCLERLVLRLLSKLREIPSSIGDIPTLKSIKVEYCSDSAKESARRMREECDSQVLQIQVK